MESEPESFFSFAGVRSRSCFFLMCRSWSRSRFCRCEGVGVRIEVVIVFCDSDSALDKLNLHVRYSCQMYETHKQACVYALNSFRKTVSLLALNKKLIKNGFCFKSTDQRIDFLKNLNLFLVWCEFFKIPLKIKKLLFRLIQ